MYKRQGKSIKVVNDVVMSPTYTRELAERIKNVIEYEAPFGIYHITNEGQCSWFEFASAIFELTGLNPDVTPVTLEDMRHKARRPKFSALENRNLKEIGIRNMSHWKEALEAYLIEKGHISRMKGGGHD